jgi:endonuclease-3
MPRHGYLRLRRSHEYRRPRGGSSTCHAALESRYDGMDRPNKTAIPAVIQHESGREPDAAQAMLRVIDARLAATYGRPTWRSHGPPLDELIATVLSQHTSDVNSAVAFSALRSRFPRWHDVMEAPVSSVADAIRPGGLANVKAPRIQAILRQVVAQSSSLSLDWLRELPVPQARAWLQSLPGVGPKTAACVLLFSLGLPAMPVDTHVHRVTRRLGLIKCDTDANQAHIMLERLIGEDRDAIYALHLNLIRHGREVCKAREPRCDRCALANVCPSAFSHSMAR